MVQRPRAVDGARLGVRRLQPRHPGRRHATRLGRRRVGWRNGFLGLAAITLLVAILFYIVVRDRPPGSTLPTTHKEPLADVFRGLWQVWRTKGLLPLLSMHFFAYATMLTVLGVWGGPYLYDVHKLDGVQRGNVLLAMGVAQTIGILCYGPMDRILRSRKKAVILGTYVTAALLLALAAIAKPSLPVAVVLLVAICFCSPSAR